MCIPSMFVHMKNTTGHNSKERKFYVYHSSCSQCGKIFDVEEPEKDHVSAHVVSYPFFCFNCCIGIKTLKTTCKMCNNTKNAESAKGKSFFGGSFDHNPNMGWVCFPLCFNYKAKSESESLVHS